MNPQTGGRASRTGTDEPLATGAPTTGADPMVALRAELCRQAVGARGDAVVLAELRCLVRMAHLPTRPGRTGGPSPLPAPPLDLALPEVVVPRLVRLLAAVATPAPALRVVGPLSTPDGRSAVTGRTVRARRRLRVELPIGDLGRRVGLLDLDGQVVRGMPGGSISRGRDASAAAWRAAVLARGEWAPTGLPSGQPPVLGVCCANEVVAGALAVFAGPLLVPSATRPCRPASRSPAIPDAPGAVLLRAVGPGDIHTLLCAIGAPLAAARWCPGEVRD